MTPDSMTTKTETGWSHSEEARGALKEQRELALACFILSATLSVAVVWSNLGGEPKAMTETREAVEVHRKLLQQHQVLLAVNEKALADVVAVRDALVRARIGH